MKAKFAIATIALALSSSAAFADYNSLENGEIIVTGLVTNSSCSVKVGENGKNGLVILSPIDRAQLIEKKVVAQEDFTVTVSNCDIGKDGKLSVAITGDVISGSAGKTLGLLKNHAAAETQADHVFIGLLDKNTTSVANIVPGVSKHVASKTFANNEDVVFTYSAGYGTDSVKNASAGNVAGLVNYTVSYQ